MIYRNHRKASEIIRRHSNLIEAIQEDLGTEEDYQVETFDNLDGEYMFSVYADFGTVAYRVSDWKQEPLWYCETLDGTFRGVGVKEGANLEEAFKLGFIDPT